MLPAAAAAATIPPDKMSERVGTLHARYVTGHPINYTHAYQINHTKGTEKN